MNLWQRAVTSLRQQGVGGSVLKVLGMGAERWFDMRYGTDTCARSQLDELTIDSANKEKGRPYEPTRVMPLRRLGPELRKIMPADSVLVDLGCGKGRVLLLASRWGFREVRGIEFARELCEIAEKNIAIYRAKTGVQTRFEVIHADVTLYPIKDDENIFFAFNPFDETLFKQVIDNIDASVRKRPRKTLVVVAWPIGKYTELLERHEGFSLLSRLRYWGCDFSVYASRAPGK